MNLKKNMTVYLMLEGTKKELQQKNNYKFVKNNKNIKKSKSWKNYFTANKIIINN